MPCNSDHMAPTQREQFSRRMCQLVCYTLGALNRPVPDWALKGRDEYYGDSKRVDEATVLLCEAVRGMTGEERTRIVYDGRSAVARVLADFWDEHERADVVRLALEAKTEREQREHDEAEFQRLAIKLGKKGGV